MKDEFGGMIILGLIILLFGAVYFLFAASNASHTEFVRLVDECVVNNPNVNHPREYCESKVRLENK